MLSHVAQDTAHSWFWACLTQAIFGLFLGHNVESEGKKGRGNHGAIEAHNHFLSFVSFDEVWGLFWATKCAVLGGHLPTWRPRLGRQR